MLCFSAYTFIVKNVKPPPKCGTSHVWVRCLLYFQVEMPSKRRRGKSAPQRKGSPGNISVETEGFVGTQTGLGDRTGNDHSQPMSTDGSSQAEDPNYRGAECPQKPAKRGGMGAQSKSENISRRWQWSTGKCFHAFIHVFQMRPKKLQESKLNCTQTGLKE